jgi:phospholipid/cholesterol/gamma-HCH transport system substrate-binding protein
MKRFDLELTVGVFVLAGILCLGFISVKLAKMELMGGDNYEVYAVFTDVGGLKTGSSVVIAGTEVGRISSIALNEDYNAKVVLSITTNIKLQADASVAVKTRGLIGEKYLSLNPGGGVSETITPGGQIRETLPPVDFEELISKYVFGKV